MSLQLIEMRHGALGYPALRAARIRRSRTLAAIVLAAMRSALAFARSALARYRQRRQLYAVYDALRELDDHTLRDLGFHRSELGSIAAEAAGLAERTRIRVAPRAHGLSPRSP